MDEHRRQRRHFMTGCDAAKPNDGVPGRLETSKFGSAASVPVSSVLVRIRVVGGGFRPTSGRILAGGRAQVFRRLSWDALHSRQAHRAHGPPGIHKAARQASLLRRAPALAPISARGHRCPASCRCAPRPSLVTQRGRTQRIPLAARRRKRPSSCLDLGAMAPTEFVAVTPENEGQRQ